MPRRVRFSEAAQLHRVPNDSEWYSDAEYDAIKETARATTVSLRKFGPQLVSLIERTWTESGDDVASLSGPLEDWCGKGRSGRGLEKYCSTDHHRTRLAAAQHAMAAVLKEALSPEAYAERSSKGVFFARALGEADAAAAREILEPPPRRSRSPVLSSPKKAKTVTPRPLNIGPRLEHAVLSS